MQILKTKRVRLHGKALAELVESVRQRDNERCVICGAYVPQGEKSHHEPQGADKSDELSKMVTLCMGCHYERHHGKNGKAVKERCEEYLRGLGNG